MESTLQNTTIAQLNDAFRKTFSGGVVVMTHGFQSLPGDSQKALLSSVQSFNHFNEDNDPYGEHDFGAILHNGQRIFWKLDYYNPTMDAGSDNPADPAITKRVLTIMLADEY
jgi:Protein of unknown function (DUF3768)